MDADEAEQRVRTMRDELQRKDEELTTIRTSLETAQEQIHQQTSQVRFSLLLYRIIINSGVLAGEQGEGNCLLQNLGLLENC